MVKLQTQPDKGSSIIKLWSVINMYTVWYNLTDVGLFWLFGLKVDFRSK